MQRLRARHTAFDILTNQSPPAVLQQDFEELNYQSDLETYLVEINQIFEIDRHVWVGGGRFQFGDFSTVGVLDRPSSNGMTNDFINGIFGPPIVSHGHERFQRGSLYGYHTWELRPRFLVTYGLAYDRIRYPANFRFPPVSPGSVEREKLSPKAALLWDIRPELTLRGMYCQALGGVSFDESFRLEPVQLAGFSQAFRSVISEAEAGSVAVPEHEIAALALDAKFKTRTYAGLQAQLLKTSVRQVLGAFDDTGLDPPPVQAFPSHVLEHLHYDEKAIMLTIDQLLGDSWAVGASYRYTQSELRWRYPSIPNGASGSPNRVERADMQHIGAHLVYNHPSGLFGRIEADWFLQENDGYPNNVNLQPRPGESTYQAHLFLGWRFFRRRGDITLGCLNFTGQDYRLSSLTPVHDLPRERVFLARVRLNF